MTETDIKTVFDRTFNGMANPIFCRPYKYFEHNGFLCECASSPSKLDMMKVADRKIYGTPLGIFHLMFANQGNMLTVLTKDGSKTDFGGHFDTEEELTTLLEEIK